MKPYSRRTFFAQASATVCALSVRRILASSFDSATVVHAPAGALRGESAEGVRVFRAVPYAAPPIGPLRFRSPLNSKPWAGERDATRFSASPMQIGEHGVTHSEDCLYLNIWAPPESSARCPVFVWIHGGGFTGGHAFEPMYDGAQFAREGIVCVTVEYRLGVFGFLDLEPLLGAEYIGSANNGLRDLMMALDWVQRNIASFGGDPSRVTIGGESAGAKLIDILMGIPEAKPLFQQAISESGGAERVWPKSSAALVAEGFGRTWASLSNGKAETLRTAPAASLIEAQQAFITGWPLHFPLRPELDGSLLPQLPVEAITASSTRGKRLLIGTNRDESALFVGPHPAPNASAADLGNMKQADFLAVFDHYKSVYPELSAEQLRIRALTAEEYWIPSIRVADAHVKGGGQAWMYRLDFAETSGRLAGYAYHSLDVGLVWSKPHPDMANAAAEAALSRQVHDAWSSFIRTGTPAAPALPAWPHYDTNLCSTMILNSQSRIEQHPQAAELHLWDGRL